VAWRAGIRHTQTDRRVRSRSRRTATNSTAGRGRARGGLLLALCDVPAAVCGWCCWRVSVRGSRW
jgi:hypothetical protein